MVHSGGGGGLLGICGALVAELSCRFVSFAPSVVVVIIVSFHRGCRQWWSSG